MQQYMSAMADDRTKKAPRCFFHSEPQLKQEGEFKSMEGLNNLFMDTTEKEAAILGEGILHRFLTKGILKSHYCILTNKRMYVRGTYFHNTDRAYRIRKGEYTIDVRDITSSGFSTARFGGVFVLEILFVILLSILTGFFLLFVQAVDHLYFGLDTIIWNCIILLIIGLVAVPIFFYFSPCRIFVIEYTGGKIAFLSFGYLDDDFRMFQRELFKVKDAYLDSSSQRPEGANGANFEKKENNT